MRTSVKALQRPWKMIQKNVSVLPIKMLCLGCAAPRLAVQLLELGGKKGVRGGGGQRLKFIDDFNFIWNDCDHGSYDKHLETIKAFSLVALPWTNLFLIHHRFTTLSVWGSTVRFSAQSFNCLYWLCLEILHKIVMYSPLASNKNWKGLS